MAASLPPARDHGFARRRERTVRIALNHTRFSPAGGAENYILRLADHLLARGDEVHMFGRRTAPLGHERACFHHVRCIPFPQELRILSFAYGSARRIAAERFDLTIGLGRTFGHDIHRDSSGTVRCFCDALAPYTRSRFYRRVTQHIERRLYGSHGLLATFTVSEFVRRQIQSAYAIPDERIAVLYNGVEDHRPRLPARPAERADVRRSMGTNDDRLVALFIGNDWRRKGLDRAIEGLCRARAPWELWVIGEDRRGGALRRALPDKSGGRVRFLGQRRTSPFFTAADAFLFPSRFDPLSNVVLEAMACEVPVIVSPNDGAAEIVRNDTGGIVLENPQDAGEIAARLDALADPATRAGMRTRAASTVARLTWNSHFAQLDELLARVRKEKTGRIGEHASARALEPA